MNKFLASHRRRVGDFDLLDWEGSPEARAVLDDSDTAVPLEANWTWEYGSEVQELRALYEKGKLNQWNAETDLDWEAPVSNDDWVIAPEGSLMAQACKLMGKDEATQKAAAFDELGYLLSQLLHGEQAALELCGQLTNVCEKMDQKLYAASQVIDEARHIEVFSKFLARKMDGVHPISATLKMLLDELLAAEGMKKKTLGMQTLFEGTAVGIMDMFRQQSANPFVTEMIRRVEQDESRHAAFGVLTMRRVVKHASEEEMAEMEDWAFSILETLNAGQQLDMLRTFGPKYDLDPEALTTALLSMPEFPEINSLMFMHTVVPNLQRLGLITDRTREQWLDTAMMVEQRGAATGGSLPLVG